MEQQATLDTARTTPIVPLEPRFAIGSHIRQPAMGPDVWPASKPFTEIGLVILSEVLGAGGEASYDELKKRLAVVGVSNHRMYEAVNSIFQEHGFVEGPAGHVAVTEAGVDFVREHTGFLDEAYAGVLEKKKKPFSPVRYILLDYLEQNRQDDGWLFSKAQKKPVTPHLRKKLCYKGKNFSNRITRYRDQGFIEVEMDDNTGAAINIFLTVAGEEDLRVARTTYADKIAAMDVVPDDIEEASLLGDRTEVSLSLVAAEINNMLAELGETPKDFSRLESASPEEKAMALERLRELMEKLEARIDKKQLA